MQALSFLTPATLAAFVEPMHALLCRMEAQLRENPELLTDQGRDRMFTSASGSLARINKLLAVALSVEQADQEVCLCRRPLVAAKLYRPGVEAGHAAQPHPTALLSYWSTAAQAARVGHFGVMGHCRQADRSCGSTACTDVCAAEQLRL